MSRRFLTLAVLAGTLALVPRLPGAEYWMFVGTYTSGPSSASKGIYAWRFDAATGKFTDQGLVAETPNPSFLAAHPNGKFLYAVNEISHFQRMASTGSVTAFAIDPASAKLTLLNAQGSLGDGPCHLALDRQGTCLIAANYNSGSIAAFPVGSNGLLNQSTAFFQHRGSGPVRDRQQTPHAHCIAISPDERFALVADLGLDEVLSYRFDPAKAAMNVNDPPFLKLEPGSGPRHLAFHPNARFLYVINELNSTIDALAYDAQNGSMRELQSISTLPKDYTGHNDTAEIQVHPSGKFLYGSNRGHDSIAVFMIDRKAGTLTPVEYVPTQGKTPRNFTLDPTGTYLLAANEKSNNIVVFKIDRSTGRLTATGQVLNAPSPVCLTFVPVK